MFSAFASRSINSNIVTAINNLISAILPFIIAIPLFNTKTINSGKFGLLMSVLAGICIAIFALSFNKSLQVNKVALVSPVVFGGVIFLTTILGSVFFKEKISQFQLYVLLLLGLGFSLIIYAAVTGK